MKWLHAHRFQERLLDSDVRVFERLYWSGRVDHPRPLRQLLVMKLDARVEHHRRAVFIQSYYLCGTSHRISL